MSTSSSSSFPLLPCFIVQGRRHFEVDLRRDANGRHFVKVTEFSGSRRSSLLIAADDADDFLVAFLGLDSGDGAAGEDSGLVEQRIEGFSKLDCSFKKGRFFELSLNENRHGKFYRLKVITISMQSSECKHVTYCTTMHSP